MASELQVIPATSQDIPQITEIEFSAFAGDPYQEALFPHPNDPATRQSANERKLKNWDADSTARWFLCQDRAADTTLGFAQWNIYDTERAREERHQPPQIDWCTGRKREIAMSFMGMNQRARERVWGGKPYVLLSLLCVHQDYQRRGAGTALVKWGIDVADSLGLPIHIEASPAGHQLYLKLGFRRVDTEVVKAEEWDGDRDMHYVIMVKDPASRNAVKVDK